MCLTRFKDAVAYRKGRSAPRLAGGRVLERPHDRRFLANGRFCHQPGGGSSHAAEGAPRSRIRVLAGSVLAAASLRLLASIVTIFFVLSVLERKMTEVSRDNFLWDTGSTLRRCGQRGR